MYPPHIIRRDLPRLQHPLHRPRNRPGAVHCPGACVVVHEVAFQGKFFLLREPVGEERLAGGNLGVKRGVARCKMLNDLPWRETGLLCHIKDVRTASGLGMNLQGTCVFRGKGEPMEENTV